MNAAVAPIALSCGEPAGIGPEIVEGAWAELGASCPFFLIGDPTHLPGNVPHQIITEPAEATAVSAKALPVLELGFAGPRTPGKAQPDQAAQVVESIRLAVDLTQSGKASAVCTAPINKKALKDGAGFGFPGHTEYLADLAGVDNVVMMIASDALRVVPATIHIPLSKVPQSLTATSLETTIRTTYRALMTDFAIPSPRIAVAGLNPHAGEGGAMGHEDEQLIAPVIAKLAGEGMAITGPWPADTMFHAEARSRYDAAVAMYHDQALIPAKTLAFDTGVNVTLGLPFIRTSPDHGTAFDIAGTGKASPSSLIAALRMAQEMSAARA